MASAGSGDGEPEFQIAPMIDVLLVLLIFFMSITVDQTAKVDKSIVLPLAPDAKKRENDLKNQVVVNIGWQKETNHAVVKFGEKLCDPVDQVAELLRPIRDKNEHVKVIIRGDSQTPAIEVQKVIEQIAAANVDDISISGVNRH